MGKTRLIAMMNFKDQFDHVDDLDAVERAKTNRALRIALDWLRPRNWHGSGLNPHDLLLVAEEARIPVVWVPPIEVLVEVVAAEPERRMAVLMANEEIVLTACESLIEYSDDSELCDTQTLARRALHAFRDGHHEAAMALAVSVAEGLAFWVSEIRTLIHYSEQEWNTHEKRLNSGRNLRYRYSLAQDLLDQMDAKERESRFDVMRRALLAPIPGFFTRFYAGDEDPLPETLSRHATVHQPTVAHLSRSNALLSVMLCASYLREQQQSIEDNGYD